MTNQRPEGWIEPVHEALLRPPSFFGAAPRNVVLIVHGVSVAVILAASMVKFWTVIFAAVGVSSAIQVLTAGLTYSEPNWFELVVEWLKSPQRRVDP